MRVGLSLTSDGSDDDSDNVLYQANSAADSHRLLPGTRPQITRGARVTRPDAARTSGTGNTAGGFYQNGQQTVTQMQ